MMNEEQRCPKCGKCDQVMIWSPKWNLWYRPKGSGYTALIHEAGLYWRCDGERRVEGTHGMLELDVPADALLRRVDDGPVDLANKHVAHIQRKNAQMEKIIEEVIRCSGLVAGDPGDWWCPTCQGRIAWATNDECCPDCGTYLGTCQPDDWGATLADMLKEYQAEKGGASC